MAGKGYLMKMRIASIAAALLLVGACSTSGDNAGGAGGAGGANAAGGVGAGQVVPNSVEDFRVNVGDRVFFDFDKYGVRDDQRATLQRQAAWLARNGQFNVTVEGHCDERGTREYNLALGERRANAVKEFLVSAGVAPSRINTISYGEERPAVAESNEAAWAQNRRAVTILSGPGA